MQRDFLYFQRAFSFWREACLVVKSSKASLNMEFLSLRSLIFVFVAKAEITKSNAVLLK